MSRRKERAKRRAGAEPAAAAPARGGADPAPADAGRPPSRRASARGLAVDLAILVGVFAIATAVAELAGAANLGVALGVGQVAFAVVLVVLLARR